MNISHEPRPILNIIPPKERPRCQSCTTHAHSLQYIVNKNVLHLSK